ncbi:LON peptidase substrate-binding domain-containing protein [Luminiphilus sp.]|nr:LON peptidase substrate-binding domain-containing protein [Luminiphilus sp.]
MTEIALFPLSSVLLPSGRFPMQIFEQRYVDLVARCMRENEGFGVAWLRQGSEISGGSLDTPNVGDYGTYAQIVDWDQLANGLLGITIEGQHRFDIESTWREPDGLIKAKVVFHDAPIVASLPEDQIGLAEVLTGLLRHPQIKRLSLQTDVSDAWRVCLQLAQLLPLEEAIKYELLGIDSIDQLLDKMDTLLKEISGDGS